MGRIRHLFWNNSEERLRAGWRLAIQLALNLGLALFLLRLANAWGSLDFTASPAFSVVVAVLSLVATLGSVWLAGRFLDRRAFTDFGLLPRQGWWWADLAAGLVAGFLMAASLVLLSLALGWARLEWAPFSGIAGVPVAGAMLLSVVLYGCTGLFEEVGRAYQERNLLEGAYAGPLGPVGSMVVAAGSAALISVVMHRGDASYLLYVFVAAAVLGLFYLLTGRMALAAGVHTAYDFAMFAVIGVGAEEGSAVGALFLVTQDALIQPDTAEMAFMPTGLALILAIEVAGLLLMLGWVRMRYGCIALHQGLWRPTLRTRR